MNAIATEIVSPPTIEDALAAVRAAVAQLRTIEAQHLSNEASCSRGRDRLGLAAAEVERINLENQAAVSRHAGRLAEQVRKGGSGAVPALVPTEKHLMAEISAGRTHQAAIAMMQSLQATVDESAAKVASAKRATDEALAQLRSAEIHHRIFDCLELLGQFENTYAEIAVRTEIRGDSKFGEQLYDGPRSWQDATALMLRSVWNTLAHRRFGPNSVGGVLAEQPPLIAARAALAKRDQELLTSKEEPTP